MPLFDMGLKITTTKNSNRNKTRTTSGGMKTMQILTIHSEFMQQLQSEDG